MMFKKPKGITYTQMAMWIDENFYKEDCDINKAYEYMYLLAYMLGCKSGYFHSTNDYDGYASHLAYSTFSRMSDKTKKPIKSVLNYMKSIQYFRKLGYESMSYSEIIDPEYNKSWDSDRYLNNYRQSIESENKLKLRDSILELFETLPTMIKENIPKIYLGDKILYKNVYISCLMSMLNRVTLPKVSEDYLREKVKSSVTFNEYNYYRKHLDQELILWNIPNSMADVIKVVLNKVTLSLIDEIKSYSNEIKIPDEEFSNIVATAFGENNEASNY